MKRGGFSLIETVLATFILSLITMAVFNIFPSSVMAVKRGEMELEADSIAQQILEEHRAGDFHDLEIGGPSALPPVKIANTVFQPRVQILAIPGSEPDLLKSVRVLVEWKYADKTHSLIREAWIASVES